MAPRSLIEPMTPVDLLFFRGERSVARRPTMTAVYLLDRTPEWNVIEHTVERVSREFPRWRQRVIEPTAGLGGAKWVTDPDFDLSYHLRRVVVPAPGTVRAMLDIVERDLMSPLDTARPLWEVTLYEGLEGGSAAFAVKSSHAVTDGIGGINFIELLFDTERDAEPRPMPPVPLPVDVTPDELAREAARRLPLAAASTVRSLVGRVAGIGATVVSGPRKAVTDVADYVASLRRVMGSTAPPSPLLAGRSLSRRVAWIELPLADLQAAARAADASLNDAYLSGLCGGLRRYHEALGMPVDALPLSIPISLRTDPSGVGGNHFAGATLVAPLGEADPVARMHDIGRQVRAARGEIALSAMNAAGPLLSALPAGVMDRLADAMSPPDVQASNVPGSRTEQYLGGALVTRGLGIGPLPGVAMMAVLLSYAGTCTITVNYDPASVTDRALFEACVREGFAELVATAVPAAKPKPTPTRKARARAQA